MPVKRDTNYARALRRKGDVRLNTEFLMRVKVNKTAKQIPARDALAIQTAVERILLEDPRALVYAIGGVARMFKGQQPFFRDIDLAVVTSKGGPYQKLSTRKFKKEIQDLTGKEVDVFPFKRQHFKPKVILQEMGLERKQNLHPIYSLAEGIPLNNLQRATNFQKKLEPYLKMAYGEKERGEIMGEQVKRSIWRRLTSKK
jgi:predicted nucleotidyltransferase